MAFKKFKSISLTLLSLFFSITLSAQNSHIKQLTVANGLASATVYKVLQDSKGYMWFATSHGVQKFDGKNFETITTDQGLLDNNILGLYEDSKGRIWMTGLNGQLAFCDGNTIHTSKNDSLLVKFHADTYITDILEIGQDSFLVANYNSSTIAFIHDNDVEYIPINESFMTRDNTFGMGKLSNGEIYILSTYYMMQFDPDQKTIQKKSLSSFENCFDNFKSRTYLDFKDKIVRQTFQKNSDFVMFYLKEHIIVIDLLNDRLVKDIDIGNNSAYFLQLNAYNMLTVGTNNGMFLYDLTKQESDKGFLQHFFQGMNIYSYYEDRDENNWVCTNGNGVFFINSRVTQNTLPQKNLPQKIITDIAYDNISRLWLAYEDGTFIVYNVNNKKTEFSKKYHRIFSLSKYKNFIYVNDLRGLIRFDQNFYSESVVRTNVRTSVMLDSLLFIGSSATCFIINPYTNWTISINTSRNNSILKSSNDEIYIGTTSQLFAIPQKNIKQLQQRFVKSALNMKHKEKSFFISDSLVYNPTNKNIMVYYNFFDLVKDDILFSLPTNAIDISESGKGSVWVATSGEGVYQINNKKVVRQITMKDGLSSNLTSQVISEHDSIVWVATNKGLNKINLTTNPIQIDIFDNTTGLPGDDISVLTQQGDTLWIGTTTGVGFINTKTANNENPPIPTYITELYVNNQLRTITPTIDLSNNQNLIQFKFIGISFQNSERVNYRYKLTGLDNNWKVTTSNTIQYDFLPPGKYSFFIESRINNGEWNAAKNSVSFVINPPFYDRWWFLLLVVLILYAIIYFAVRYRISQITTREKMKAEFENRLLVSELKTLRLQMNPHFIFNSLNSIQYFFSNNEPDIAVKYVSKFSKLIRMILENSRRETISLEEEITSLQLYLEIEEIRFDYNFCFEIICDQQLNTNSIEIIPMIIQPFVENAIIHGVRPKKKNGKITLSFLQEGDDLLVWVDDNGIGREESERRKSLNTASHQSLGLTVAYERLESLNKVYNQNATIEIIDKKDNQTNESLGTKVVIRFPKAARKGGQNHD